ncbi:MAG: SIS domain-containing protein [Clostridia bacterium]|nr:SIS domain-containing protein [Clostridia bacterium]
MDKLIKKHPELAGLENKINNAIEILKRCYESGNKILLIGNGGSSADCAHFAGELLNKFNVKRPISNDFYAKLSTISSSALDTANVLQKGIPCIDLTSFTSALTAISNDVGYNYAFANLFYSLYNDGDVLVAFTTSGKSKNVIKALEVAKALNAKTITFTGKNGIFIKDLATVDLSVNETETYLIQELHLPIYHYVCKRLEELLFLK